MVHPIKKIMNHLFVKNICLQEPSPNFVAIASYTIDIFYSRVINQPTTRTTTVKHQIKRSSLPQFGTSIKHHEQPKLQYFLDTVKVLKFETPLIFNENIKPILMPEARGDEWMTPGSKVRVCGWGNTSPIGSLYPSKLHCVDTFVSMNP